MRSRGAACLMGFAMLYLVSANEEISNKLLVATADRNLIHCPSERLNIVF